MQDLEIVGFRVRKAGNNRRAVSRINAAPVRTKPICMYVHDMFAARVWRLKRSATCHSFAVGTAGYPRLPAGVVRLRFDSERLHGAALLR